MNLQNLIDYSKMMNEPDPLYGVELPDPLDAEKCKSAILMRCGLLEPVYNDPRVFREMIYTWFHIRDWNFKHLIAIIQAEYSPIENTDRYSEHEILTAGTDSKSRAGKDARTIGTTGSDSSTRTIGTTGSDSRTRTPELTRTMTDEISAENEYDYQPDSKHTTRDTGTETTAGSRSENVVDNLTHNETENVVDNLTHNETESGKRDGTETYKEHTHGNIGVTSNVQLINEETELLRRFNVYDWIAERLEETFFIMVY